MKLPKFSSRKTFDKKHILEICESVDCGMLAPPMKAQVAVDELCRYFLGDDWYDSSGLTNCEQINAAIVCEIEQRYKGAKIMNKKKGIYEYDRLKYNSKERKAK